MTLPATGLLRVTARFLTIGLMLHIALSWAFVRFVCPAHEAWERDGWFLARGDEVKVVVCGGSHAFMAVRDEPMPAMLNIATHGEHYVRTLHRMRWLMERRPEGIEVALVSFDAASFSPHKTDHFRPEAVWGRYVPYLELARSRPTHGAYVGMWFRSRFAPYWREAETVGQYVRGHRAFRRRNGAKVDVQIQTAEQVAERHFPTPGDTWDPAKVAALREILALFEGYGVRVVLVSYPMHAAYTSKVALRGVDPQQRKDLLEELVEPGVVDHLNYEDLFGTRRAAFADPDHLSPLGSRLLTQQLIRDLRELGIRGQAAER